MSHSSSSFGVSSLGFGGPVISSLLGVETTTSYGILSLLLMEVRSSTKSTDTMRVSMFLTSGWSTSSLNITKNKSESYLKTDQEKTFPKQKDKDFIVFLFDLPLKTTLKNR